MPTRRFKAQVLLRDNVRTLLVARRQDQTDLARFCGHKPPWINKILSGERNATVKDLDRIADFFGLEVPDLFRPGISPLLDRRSGRERRIGPANRRGGPDRRHRFRPAITLADAISEEIDTIGV